MGQTLSVPDPLADLALLPGVPSAVATTTAAVDAVLRDRGRRRWADPQVDRAQLAAARANADLTADPARRLAGAVRLAAELGPLAALIRSAPAQALARADLLVGRGVADDEQLGRVSGGPEVAARMAGLTALLTGDSTASSLILAAVVHAEIAVLEPFGQSSGMVARGAEQLVLMAAGLDPAGLLVVPGGHLDSGPAYAAGLAAYAQGSQGGVTRWILHCCGAVARGAERLAMLAMT